MSEPNRDLYLTAARAWCRHKFPYGGGEPEKHYRLGTEGERQHIEYDASSTANESWLRVIVDVVVAAVGRDVPALVAEVVEAPADD